MYLKKHLGFGIKSIFILCVLSLIIPFSYAFKHIAIVNSDSYSLDASGDSNHYTDNVTVLLKACEQIDSLQCKAVNLEEDINWKQFDVLILGAIYNGESHDIYKHISEWLFTREAEGIRVINGPNAVKFVYNKLSYLKQLQSNDIPIIPTIYVSPESTDACYISPESTDAWLDIFDIASECIIQLLPEQVNIRQIFHDTTSSKIVIKSATTTLGLDNFVVERLPLNELQTLQTTPYLKEQQQLQDIASRSDVLIQKFMPEITEGEISFVYLNGEMYAYKKTPAKGEYKVHQIHGGTIEQYDPTLEEKTQALNVITAVSKITKEKIYKARVDMVKNRITNKLVLMEIELADPSLLLTHLFGEQKTTEMMTKYLNSLFN